MSSNCPRIAVIGMACRTPGSANVASYWTNLRYGVESISFFSDEELLERGVPAILLNDPRYVRAGAVLENADLFASEFFGYSPREAEMMDPQHRIFLECAWHAMEDAGYGAGPDGPDRRVGVFAGATMNTYLPALLARPDLIALMGEQQVMLANDKDYLATRVSYHLDLRGPSMAVQTACSSSLTAVHLACQSLLTGECDMALAGGASVRVPQGLGYRYQSGGTSSPDGHCRAFDAAADGSVAGSGVGVVVLRRLEDALAAGDTIRSIILGSAINNDGARKVGFTAPSVAGQTQAVLDALAVAEVPAETITYLEPHGTGTRLGDAIELTALSRAYQASSQRKGFCALGSVKTNIGHLDAAAGIVGLIKVVLCLEHRQLVPSLHFNTPNSEIDWANGPFYVNTRLKDWPAGNDPRRAACSSFGMGGTNAHVILEEPPEAAPSPPVSPVEVLLVSARTPEELERASARLAAHLELRPEQHLAAVCFTSRVGRKHFSYRRAAVGSSRVELIAGLRSGDRGFDGRTQEEGTEPRVAFLFPGQGAESFGMGRALYQEEPSFRASIDNSAEILAPILGADFREVFGLAGEAPADSRSTDPSFVQPGLFAVEYALAQVWLGWGCRPAAVAGHSLGEYVAACLAGVFPLNAALRLVAARGRLAAGLPPGGMAAISIREPDLLPFLNDGVALAAVNAPGLCTVSGSLSGLETLRATLASLGVGWLPLAVARAYHSPDVEAMTASFREEIIRAQPRRPELPMVSNLTGTWLTADQATDPGYWTDHLRRPVRFADGIQVIRATPGIIFVEVGPSAILRKLLGHASWPDPITVVSSLPERRGAQSESAALYAAAARVWVEGGPIDWQAFTPTGQRVPLPGYPFTRSRHWIDAPSPFVVPPPASFVSTSPPRSTTAPPSSAPPYLTDDRSSSGYAIPETEVERRVAVLWEEMLGVHPIGRTDNFFDLGGHSLLAVQLISRLRMVFEVELPVATFLDHPTVADLSAHILTALPQSVFEAPPTPSTGMHIATPAPVLMPKVEDADLEAILTEIERLSPDEVRDRLTLEASEDRYGG